MGHGSQFLRSAQLWDIADAGPAGVVTAQEPGTFERTSRTIPRTARAGIGFPASSDAIAWETRLTSLLQSDPTRAGKTELAFFASSLDRPVFPQEGQACLADAK